MNTFKNAVRELGVLDYTNLSMLKFLKYAQTNSFKTALGKLPSSVGENDESTEEKEKPPSIPLEPALGGRIGKEAALKRGDLLLVTLSDAAQSKIPGVTGEKICQAMMYFKNDQVLTSNRNDATLAEIVEGSETVVIVRHHLIASGFNVPDVEEIPAWSKVSKAFFRLDEITWYRSLSLEDQAPYKIWVGHINLGTNDRKDGFFSFYCPKLVLQACENAGTPITVTPANTTKDPSEVPEIKLRGSLGYVGHLKSS